MEATHVKSTSVFSAGELLDAAMVGWSLSKREKSINQRIEMSYAFYKERLAQLDTLPHCPDWGQDVCQGHFDVIMVHH